MTKHKKLLSIIALVLAFTMLAGCDLVDKIDSFLKGEQSESSSEAESSEEDESTESSEESSEPEPRDWPVTVEGVLITEQPQKVVVLSPSLCEIMSDMGFTSLIVGIGDYCNYPEQITAKPKCGTSIAPDVEAITELAPQYLFTSSNLPEEELKKLQQANIEVIVLTPAKRLSELEKLYKNIAIFAAGAETGAAAGEEHWGKCTELLNSAIEKAGKIEGVETMLYLRIADLTVATADTIEGELITKLGFTNAAEKYGGWTYPEEDVENLSPDAIIADAEITENELEKSDIYSGCGAVKQKMIVRTDMSCFERQGIRMFRQLLDVVTRFEQLQSGNTAE
ncbi:MAG: ABC transporter substrate-binding protein [Oscillospiraceae bacterium]|nr:ABC transporter substrate-binding protein [Oscillospiraceae bacterium]